MNSSPQLPFRMSACQSVASDHHTKTWPIALRPFDAMVEQAGSQLRTLAGLSEQQFCAGAVRDTRDLSARTLMLLLNIARQVRLDDTLAIAQPTVLSAVKEMLSEQATRDRQSVLRNGGNASRLAAKAA